MTNTILVIAAHPDDEVLGCGSTIAKHAANNDQVHVLFLAEGVTARDSKGDIDKRKNEILAREKMGDNAAKVLGINKPEYYRNLDNRLDQVALIDLAKIIENKIKELNPEIIYTHHGGDLNIDHRRVHEAVLTACRPQPGFPVKAIYAFETPSSTEWASPSMHKPFVPVKYVDITDFLDKKLAALECYAHEMREYPHPRSEDAIIALARYRGTTVGCPVAEAFEVLRIIE